LKQRPYCYPGTDVLINKEDIRNKDDLERMATARRLETLPRGLPITPKGYREIHRYMLQDVYDWAGKYRWVDTGRGPAPFALAQYIEPELNKRFAAIRAERGLTGLSSAAFAARAAEYLNEINAIHPFLDGNGRAPRAFLEIVAEQAGHEIDLARVDPEAWNRASILGFYKGNHEPMRQVIAGAILPP